MKLKFKFTVLLYAECDTCIFFVSAPPDKESLWGSQFEDFGRCVNSDAIKQPSSGFTDRHWGCKLHKSIEKKL
jgi:hypothetical protein